MRIILSPAKKMKVDTDSFATRALPQFLPEAETLKTALQGLPDKQLQTLWNCNDSHCEAKRGAAAEHEST